ncbi:MAG: cache domain-containing protein, partial [Rhodocyclaceae bacterium]
MTDSFPASPPPATGVVTVVLVYAVFAGLWILLSDAAVSWLVSDPVKAALVSTVKGWAFVAVTSLLLFGLMRRLLRFPDHGLPVARTTLRTLRLPLAIVFVVIALLVAVGIFHTMDAETATQGARLVAIADLKTRQISDWLKERHGDARFVQSSQVYAGYYRDWRQRGDLAQRDALLGRLDRLRGDNGFASILILDEQGEPLWDSANSSLNADRVLRAAAREAVASHTIGQIGPYRDENGRVNLDFIAPVAGIPGQAPAVVLRVDPEDYLYPLLKAWPVPSTSGETLLFRREGGQVLYLNTLRHAADTAAKLRQPVASTGTLAALVLRGDAPQGSLIQGVDYRGVAAMGVVRSVPGTDWFLVAKIDATEAYAEVTGNVLGIILAGVFALFAAGAGAFMFRQRQELADGLRESAAQAEKLQALQLLDAIVSSSGDAIYAK